MILYNRNKTQMSEERNEKVVHVLTHRQNNLTIVLENVNDPHNIAAVQWKYLF
jgi:tRNA (guanosine-2'-O-)-methyltransferase